MNAEKGCTSWTLHASYGDVAQVWIGFIVRKNLAQNIDLFQRKEFSFQRQGFFFLSSNFPSKPDNKLGFSPGFFSVGGLRGNMSLRGQRFHYGISFTHANNANNSFVYCTIWRVFLLLPQVCNSGLREIGRFDVKQVRSLYTMTLTLHIKLVGYTLGCRQKSVCMESAGIVDFRTAVGIGIKFREIPQNYEKKDLFASTLEGPWN
jgi:hypothetical protein